MTLFDNIEFRFRGQPLPSAQWQPVIAKGISTVADIWSARDGVCTKRLGCRSYRDEQKKCGWSCLVHGSVS